MKPLRVFVATAVMALAFSSSSIARADDAEDARAAMRRGSAALERGDNEAALTEYDAAKKLVPNANAPYFFAAEALTRMGRWREAVANLESYLAKDPNVSDAAMVKQRIAKAKTEHFPGRVRVLIRPEGVPATIMIDGRPPPAEDAAIELMPGEHHLDVTSPNRKSVAQDIRVIGDVDREIAIDLGPELQPVTPPPPPLGSTTTTEPTVLPTVGLIIAGAGAAGLVTSILLDATLLESKKEDFNEAAANRDTAGARDARSDFESAQTGVLVSYIASSVLLVGGAALWFFAPKERKTTSSTAGIRPSASGFRFVF